MTPGFSLVIFLVFLQVTIFEEAAEEVAEEAKGPPPTAVEDFIKSGSLSILGGASHLVRCLTTRWWFQIFFNVHPYLGKIPILTNIFSDGLKTTN